MKNLMMVFVVGLTASFAVNASAQEVRVQTGWELSDDEAREITSAKAAKRQRDGAVATYKANYMVFEPEEFGRVGYRLGDGRLLEGAEFYNAIDRPDLAEHYSSRESHLNAAKGLVIAGSVGFTTGMVLAVGDTMLGFFGAMMGPMGGGVSSNSAGLPYWIMGASGGLIITGVVIAPWDLHPVSKEEAAKLVDDYNKNQAERLRIPSHYRRPGTSSLSKLDVNVGLNSDGNSGQLVLRVGF